MQRGGAERQSRTPPRVLPFDANPPPSDTQVDGQLFSDFKAWREEPTLDRSCSFLERVYREDIYPCLTFSKSEVRLW